MGKIFRNLFLLIALIIFLLTSSASCSLFAQGVPRSAKPADANHFLFGANDSIYSISANGSNLKILLGRMVHREKKNSVITQVGLPALSPDRKTIAYAKGETSYSLTSSIPKVSEKIPEIWLMDATGKNRRKLTTVDKQSMTGEEDVSSLQWSPDGKLLYCERSTTFFSVDMNGNKTESTGWLPSSGINMVICPDGRHVAFLEWRGITLAKIDKMLVSDPNYIFSEALFSDKGLGGTFGGADLAWQSEKDLLFIETRYAASSQKGNTGTNPATKYPESYYINRINIESRAVSGLYTTSPGDEIGDIEVSPTQTLVAFLYGNKEKRGTDTAKWPKPWTIDLRNGSASSVPLPKEAATWRFDDLSW